MSITLYTAHHCPYAHRTQIALRELSLPFTTSLIDVTSNPRPDNNDYRLINPTGMVPALTYDGHVLIESTLIVQFLLDTHPSHLLPASSSVQDALQKFRMSFFVETYFEKVHSVFDGAVFARTKEMRDTKAEEFVEAVVRHIESLLENASPFWGGCQRLTFAEVLTGPFILRVLNLPKYEAFAPTTLLPALECRAPNFWRWSQAVAAEESVLSVWDEELVVNHMHDKKRKKLEMQLN